MPQRYRLSLGLNDMTTGDIDWVEQGHFPGVQRATQATGFDRHPVQIPRTGELLIRCYVPVPPCYPRCTRIQQAWKGKKGRGRGKEEEETVSKPEAKGRRERPCGSNGTDCPNFWVRVNDQL